MGPSYPIRISRGCPFPVQNIPFGIFSTAENVGYGRQARVGTAVGEWVLDLGVLSETDIFKEIQSSSLVDIFLKDSLNDFASRGSNFRNLVRSILIRNVNDKSSPLFGNSTINSTAFVSLKEVEMHLPMKITSYTDSFINLIHAKNGLLPFGIPVPSAFYHYPMAYNGRVSSVVSSPAQIPRPCGFVASDVLSNVPIFGPTEKLDFELELGVFLSSPLPIRASSVPATDVMEKHVFGYVLLNDWSARDIQSYEMNPLGPFHSKGFATSISPWVVTLEALDGARRVGQQGLPQSVNGQYNQKEELHNLLKLGESDNSGIFDILMSAKVSRDSASPVEIVRSNFADSYWSTAQMIAYQSFSNWGLATGDLLGTGTISSHTTWESEAGEPGDAKAVAESLDEEVSPFGCLAEAAAMKRTLPSVGGKPMSWLEDGDELTMEGWFRCGRTEDGEDEWAGFGGLLGKISPAISN